MSTKKTKRGKLPMRMCVCCEREAPKSDMIRIVISGRNTEITENTADETGKMKGRGAYICRSRACIDKALDSQLIGNDIHDELIEGLTKSGLQLIAIAMKAGKVASGEFQTEEAVKTGAAELVIIAADASENTSKKFRDKCTYYEIPFVTCADKETLGRIIGKNERSVIALRDKDFSTKVLNIFGGQE